MSQYHYILIFAIVVALVVVGCSRTSSSQTSARTEAWWAYIADYDGLPGTTTVDLVHSRRAPIPEFTSLIVTGVDYVADPEKDGLPTNDELKIINHLRNSRTKLLSSFGAIEVGTFVSNRHERHYFYARTANEIEAALKDFYQREFPSRVATTKSKEDAAWGAYREFLLPNKATIDFHRKELTISGAIEYLE